MSNTEYPPSDLSSSQIACFACIALALTVWVNSHIFKQTRPACTAAGEPEEPHILAIKACLDAAESPRSGDIEASLRSSLALENGNKKCKPTFMRECMGSPFFEVLSMCPCALSEHKDTINAAAEFAAWMLWIFLADRTSLIPYTNKRYSRDVFLACFAAVVAFSSSSLQLEKRPGALGRHQTEEWKGWMQVLFLLYHYFEAKEAYNMVRILIAAYVWLTGYGNFHYYIRTGDYTVGRFAQMLWRLNFLVAILCALMRNSYMLYYICPMHTLFTILIYASLGVANHLNKFKWGIAMKMGAASVLVLLLWEPRVFITVFGPFEWLLGYRNPRQPGADRIHEWYFRSGLDRFVWIYGMFVAWCHPAIEAALVRVDALTLTARLLFRTVVTAAAALIGWAWYTTFYTLEKAEYNAVHPYTSWIPITVWITFRNIVPGLRSRYLGVFAWLGCITLETYLSQFHVWLRTNIPDGQPKGVLDLVPGYQLVNFVICTVVYIFVSRRLFLLTNVLKEAAVPHSNNSQLAQNVVVLVISASGIYLAAFIVRHFVYWA